MAVGGEPAEAPAGDGEAAEVFVAEVAGFHADFDYSPPQLVR